MESDCEFPPFESTSRMNGSLLLWGGLAVAVFWSVGVYNRLMRMRARALDALGSVEKYMRKYASLVETHLTAPGAIASRSGGDFADASPWQEWAALQTALLDMEQALKEARAASLRIAPVNRLGAGFDAVQNAWQALCDLPADLAGPAVPDILRLQWDAITAKAQTARGGLNQILTKYNEAIHQFPARLVAGAMRFEPAGLM